MEVNLFTSRLTFSKHKKKEGECQKHISWHAGGNAPDTEDESERGIGEVERGPQSPSNTTVFMLHERGDGGELTGSS
jgi:hypothetical protein